MSQEAATPQENKSKRSWHTYINTNTFISLMNNKDLNKGEIRTLITLLSIIRRKKVSDELSYMYVAYQRGITPGMLRRHVLKLDKLNYIQLVKNGRKHKIQYSIGSMDVTKFVKNETYMKFNHFVLVALNQSKVHDVDFFVYFIISSFGKNAYILSKTIAKMIHSSQRDVERRRKRLIKCELLSVRTVDIADKYEKHFGMKKIVNHYTALVTDKEDSHAWLAKWKDKLLGIGQDAEDAAENNDDNEGNGGENSSNSDTNLTKKCINVAEEESSFTQNKEYCSEAGSKSPVLKTKTTANNEYEDKPIKNECPKSEKISSTIVTNRDENKHDIITEGFYKETITSQQAERGLLAGPSGSFILGYGKWDDDPESLDDMNNDVAAYKSLAWDSASPSDWPKLSIPLMHGISDAKETEIDRTNGAPPARDSAHREVVDPLAFYYEYTKSSASLSSYSSDYGTGFSNDSVKKKNENNKGSLRYEYELIEDKNNPEISHIRRKDHKAGWDLTYPKECNAMKKYFPQVTLKNYEGNLFSTAEECKGLLTYFMSYFSEWDDELRSLSSLAFQYGVPAILRAIKSVSEVINRGTEIKNRVGLVRHFLKQEEINPDEALTLLDDDVKNKIKSFPFFSADYSVDEFVHVMNTTVELRDCWFAREVF